MLLLVAVVLFHCSVVFHCVNLVLHNVLIHFTVDVRLECSCFWLKCLMLPWAFLYRSFKGNTHAFLLCRNVAMEFWDNKLCIYLALLTISKEFPSVGVPVCGLISNVRAF